MKAIAVTPGQKSSARLVEARRPKATGSEVLVKVIRVGIDGTDSEINDGLYGTAPDGENFLILGHESFGVVEKAGPEAGGLKKGDYVVATVRRPCGACPACAGGESDMCSTGRFKERGIMGLHGLMAEYYKEVPEFLVKVPAGFREVGVFLEPLSIVEKAVAQLLKIQERMPWSARTALVLGAGSIGLLATMLLRAKGISVCTVARSPRGCLKAKIAEACGAVYADINETSLAGLRPGGAGFDFILEATGSSAVAFEAIGALGTNGVLCLTSITGGGNTLSIPADKTNLELVLGNKLVFGTVNSNRGHFQAGIESLGEFQRLWPGLVRRMITRRCGMEDFKDALNRRREDIKTVLEIGAGTGG